MTDYATRDDVKARLGGDVPRMSDAFDDVISAKITEVSADIDRCLRTARGIRGDWSFVADPVATLRVFVAKGGKFLSIDDAVEIESVALLDDQGNVIRALTNPSDYFTEPFQGTPIVALRRTRGTWDVDGFVRAVAKWGFGLTTPADVRETCIIEVIRSYLADRVGNDDRLGLSPFGSISTSRAFTAKFAALESDYSYGGASLR